MDGTKRQGMTGRFGLQPPTAAKTKELHGWHEVSGHDFSRAAKAKDMIGAVAPVGMRPLSDPC